jgi:hypothetical protein
MQLVGLASERAQLRTRSRNVVGLVKASLTEHQGLVGAEHSRPGMPIETAHAFSRASSAATSPAAFATAARSTARSSISAGRTSIGIPAASSMARLGALFDASTKGLSASQSAITPPAVAAARSRA